MNARWRTASGRLDVSVPLYLGIVNVTPDSFSDGGRFLDPERALEHAQDLVTRGARMLDLGAESTRPGAGSLDESAEWARLATILEFLGQSLSNIPVSLDTRHAQTAKRGLASGVSVLNDVTSFSDPNLERLACKSTCGLIAMRSRSQGDGLYMPEYGGTGLDSAREAIRELQQIRDRLLKAGIDPERILLDPGFGFGTTYKEDLALWKALPELPSRLEWPVERFCIAVSRKRFLAWRADQPDMPPRDRDDLTHRAHEEALALGYRVFRTHSLP